MLREISIENGTTVDLSMNAIYIQMPILAVYKGYLPNNNNNNNSLNVGFGPYFAYGVGGKTTGPYSIKVDSFGRHSLLNRPDFGFITELQFETSKIVLSLGFERGIVNIMNDEYLLSNTKFNNWSLYFSIGYKLK